MENQRHDYSMVLEIWALILRIIGFIAAGILLYLMFSTSCIRSDSSPFSSVCLERSYNWIYIVAAFFAILQGYFSSILLKCVSIVIDNLKWINESLSKSNKT